MDIFHYSFMIRALIAGGVMAVCAPLIGNFLVIRRYSLIADTLSHVALAGVAIGLILSIQPFWAILVVTVLAALAIERIRTAQTIPADVVLAMFLPGGLAVALILISLANGFNAGLFGYLFGSIATVQSTDLLFIIPIGVLTVLTVWFFYRQLLFTTFDEESSQVIGVRVRVINTVLVILTALVVALSLRIVGILLVGALMVIPATTASLVARSFKQNLWLSIIFAAMAVITGLYLAFYVNLPAGAAIVMVLLSLFGLVSLVHARH